MIHRNSKFFFAGIVASAALTPSLVFAQIVISEFLYDAPGSDTDQEFIELFNAGGSAIDLTKWKINDGSNHVLNVPPKNGGIGSISIAPGTYLLLVDDATSFIALHSSVTGTVIDTVFSLPNTAGTISLINEEAVEVDSISYTSEDGGAGDGDSLHRTNVSGSIFAAAPATLGTGTLTSSPNVEADANTPADQTIPTSSSGNSADSTYTNVPKIFADAGSDRTVVVGAATEFKGSAYNQNKVPLDSVRFQWNFGDGSISEGARVFHRYEYPGRYAVILRVLDNTDTIPDQITVTAEPAKLFLATLPDGGVAIENRSGRTFDLSRWILRTSGSEFILPENSFILGNATMRISKNVLGFSSGPDLTLNYPDRTLAFHIASSTSNVASTSPQLPMTQDTKSAPLAAQPTIRAIPVDAIPHSDDLFEEAATTSTSVRVPPQSQVAAAASVKTIPSTVWWLGAFALAALAGGALFAAQRFGKREWDIEEIEETR